MDLSSYSAVSLKLLALKFQGWLWEVRNLLPGVAATAERVSRAESLEGPGSGPGSAHRGPAWSPSGAGRTVPKDGGGPRVRAAEQGRRWGQEGRSAWPGLGSVSLGGAWLERGARGRSGRGGGPAGGVTWGGPEMPVASE